MDKTYSKKDVGILIDRYSVILVGTDQTGRRVGHAGPTATASKAIYISREMSEIRKEEKEQAGEPKKLSPSRDNRTTSILYPWTIY